MEKRSLLDMIFGGRKEIRNVFRFETLESKSAGFDEHNLYENDVVRSCIWPIANNAGKFKPTHIRTDNNGDMARNPEPYIRFILEEPNPYMSMQDFLVKMVTQREKYNNAFAYVKRDTDGYVEEIYPIPFNNVQLQKVKSGEVLAEFTFRSGEKMRCFYDELIHLRKHFDENDYFGESSSAALKTIVDVVNTTDQGIIKAIKNSAIIRWLLKYKQVLKPEDVKINVDDFARNYLNIENSGGAIAADPRYEVEQVKPDSYVPNAALMDRAKARIQSYFQINDAIIQGRYTEDQWNAFFESVLEPISIQLSNEFTRRIFTRRERGFGNQIIFESNSLHYAGMGTKLGLVSMVDRGALTPNEWRTVLGLGPIDGGNEPIRRLDTQAVRQIESEVIGNGERNEDDGVSESEQGRDDS